MLVGNHRTMVVGGFRRLIVGQSRIELQPDLPCGFRPLCSKVVGRTDDQHPDRGLVGHKLVRDAESKASLTRGRGSHRQKVFRLIGTDRRQGSLLPVTKGRGPGR